MWARCEGGKLEYNLQPKTRKPISLLCHFLTRVRTIPPTLFCPLPRLSFLSSSVICSLAVEKVHFVPLSTPVMHKHTPDDWQRTALNLKGKCTYTNVITSYLCLTRTLHRGKWWQDKMEWTLPNVIYSWLRGAEPKAALCACLSRKLQGLLTCRLVIKLR